VTDPNQIAESASTMMIDKAWSMSTVNRIGVIETSDKSSQVGYMCQS
jgi:hypothetical protein